MEKGETAVWSTAETAKEHKEKGSRTEAQREG